MKSVNPKVIREELRASAISLLISLQALCDIQAANVEIAESASPSLDEAFVEGQRAFAQVLADAWQSGLRSLSISREEYERELDNVEQYQVGLSDADKEQENTFKWRAR